MTHKLARLGFVLFYVALSALSVAQKQGAPDNRNIVLTMRDEYRIDPAGPNDDGKHYILKRLAKDGTVYESIEVTKISEKDGEVRYSGPTGQYLRLKDGALQEPLILRDNAPVATTLPESPLTLMREVPRVPWAPGKNAMKLQSIVLPDGMVALDSSIVEGKPVLILTTEVHRDRRHTVAVERAGTHLGEIFYIRVSNASRADEPLIFGVLDNKTVTGYADLPEDVPQITTGGPIAVPPAGATAIRSTVATVQPTTGIEPSVTGDGLILQGKGANFARLPADFTHNFSVRQTAGGSTGEDREYEIRYYPNNNQIAALVPVKAANGLENDPKPTVFILEDVSRFVVYTAVDLPQDRGGPVLTAISFPKASIPVPPVTPSPAANAPSVHQSSTEHHSNEFPVKSVEEAQTRSFVYFLTYADGRKPARVYPIVDSDKNAPGAKTPILGRMAEAAGMPHMNMPNMDFTRMKQIWPDWKNAYDAGEPPAFFKVEKDGKGFKVTGSDSPFSKGK